MEFVLNFLLGQPPRSLESVVHNALFGPNVTFAQITEAQTGHYRGLQDLVYVLPVALLLIGLRSIFYRFVAGPFAEYFGLMRKVRRQPARNATLERAFAQTRSKRMPKSDRLQRLATEAGMPLRDVERWWLQQMRFTQPGKHQKFLEASWRFVYYTSSTIIGLYVLWDKPWFADVVVSWIPCSKYNVPDDVILMYMIQLGMYVSLIITMFSDIRRKDFVEMFIHHVATIGLMVFSYSVNHTRIGTLVLIVHDFSDIFLEAAKSAHYFKKKKDDLGDQLATWLFVAFAISFFASRMVLYPRVVYSAVVEAIPRCGGELYLGWFAFAAMLCTLQVLHVFWFSTIYKMAKDTLIGGLEGDYRSASDSSDESGAEAAPTHGSK